MAEQHDALRAFELERARLKALAYRMLGSFADAEDIVQEAYLRWEAKGVAVEQPGAYLSKVVTRLCLDHLKSARVQREQYVGPWLPEPVLGKDALAAGTETALANDVSVALLLALERLSPLERAAFLLHDVFDVDYDEVGEIIGRSGATCRQLAVRARTHVQTSRPRYRPTDSEAERILGAFMAAALSGDAEALARVLAEDAVLHTDGGGRVLAARSLIHGAEKISRFFVGVLKKYPLPAGASLQAVTVNTLPGFVLTVNEAPVQTMAFEIADNRIHTLYVVRNPDKLDSIRQVWRVCGGELSSSL